MALKKRFLYSLLNQYEKSVANHFENLEYDSTSEDLLAEDAAVRETIATFCFLLTHMRVWAVVIKDRAISACRDLGMPLTESAKQTASIMLQTFPISS